jgi:hypothetical protein
MYDNAAEFPNALENFVRPIAVYSRDGVIVKATKVFRDLAEITQDGIGRSEANLYDRLNTDNAELSEAARSVFDDTEVLLEDVKNPLRVKSKTSVMQLAVYPGLLFFPMSYIREDVEYGAVLLIPEHKDDTDTS